MLHDDVCGSYLKQYDIVLLCETWADPRNDYVLEGYHALNYARTKKHKKAKRSSGGLIIFIKNAVLKGIEILHNNEDLIAWLKLDKSFFGLEKHLYLGNCYVVPENSPHLRPDSFSIIQDDIAKVPSSSDILICADFNAHTKAELDYNICHPGSDNGLNHYLNPDEQTHTDIHEKHRIRICLDKRPINSHGRELLNLCKATGLLIVNGRLGNDGYTWVNNGNAGVNDYMIASTSLFQNIEHFSVNTMLPESDHAPLEIAIKCKKTLHKSSNTKNMKSWDDYCRYEWKKDNLSKLRNVIHDEISSQYRNDFITSVVELESVDIVSNQFNSYINQTIQRSFELKPIKIKHRKSSSKWFDKECKDFRNKAITAGERTETQSDRIIHDLACKQYKSLKQRKKRIYKQKCVNEINKVFASNPSNIWDKLNRFHSNNIEPAQPSNDEFFDHFRSLSNEIDSAKFDIDYEKQAKQFLVNYSSGELKASKCPLEHEILNNDFTKDEVLSAIDSLKRNKSPGADYIAPEFIKFLKYELLEDITVMYNYIIENRSFPLDWAEGIKSAIYKKGDRKKANNYRGITVPKIFEKIFEILIHNRLQFLNSAFDRVDESNGGFLKGKRTSDNIFILNGLIQKQLLMGKKLYVCFVDFSKAFDLVNRHILFFKIINSGWSGRVIDTLRDLYAKTHYRIKASGKLSPIIENLIGVNQGGNASGLLFRKYMADLCDYLDREFGIVIGSTILAHLLWADDLILMSDTLSGLKKQLRGLERFCAKNRMVVNALKTKIMVFGSSEKLELQFNGIIIEHVNEYKYLGNVIRSIKQSSSDPFLLNYDYLCSQGRKAIFLAKQKLNKIGNLPPETMFFMFNSLVKPILTYGSDVWGVHKKGRALVDKVFLQFIKRTLVIKQSTSTAMVLGESGQFLPSIDCISNTVSFLNRILNMNNNSLVLKVFNELQKLHECGFITWCTHAWDLARRYELNIYTDNSTFKKQCKQSIRQKFIEDWYHKVHDVENNPIMRTYSLIKYNFGMEPYLLKVSNFKYRNAITRLRTSSHNLLIEKGRHSPNQLPFEERLCKKCLVVEDEAHFLLSCQLYNQEREILYEKLEFNNRDKNLDSNDLLFYLLGSTSQRHLELIGQFIYTCFEKHREQDEKTT